MTQIALDPIGQIARPVKDIETARNWYGEVLGLCPPLAIMAQIKP